MLSSCTAYAGIASSPKAFKDTTKRSDQENPELMFKSSCLRRPLLLLSHYPAPPSFAMRVLTALHLACIVPLSIGWTTPTTRPGTPKSALRAVSRRSFFDQATVSALAVVSSATAPVLPAIAVDTASSTVTDRIFVAVKGLPDSPEPRRVVIGLFGKDAPNAVHQLKQLVSSKGLPAPCRARAERSLQREQLEANKVYNSCIEGQEEGVSLRYSSIWRIVKDERIDVGDVRGKFVAREYPLWQDAESGLRHDSSGVVSVRRGNDGGFGFTIYPGKGDANDLDQDHIVVGRVLEGMDVIAALNEAPVIASSKLNYMSLTGGTTTKNAPTRACRYGGPMYCNENKPLIKLSLAEVGIL